MQTKNFTNIIDALSLFELPPEEQDLIMDDLNELVFKGSLIRMMELMKATVRDEFTTLIESEASEEEIDAFITKNVPNADKAISATLAEITDDILAVTN